MNLEIDDFIPPVVHKGRRWFRRVRRATSKGQQGADHYDRVFGESEEYRRHYCDSVYYASWTVLVDRLRRAGVKRILDLGCGPGQFAEMLSDSGFADYTGVDFSSTAIEMAKKRVNNRGFVFHVADALKSELVENDGWDVVVSLEFLEHVDFDLDVLARIRAGTRVLATVPNFAATGHVRHFTSVAAVAERYGKVLADLRVDEIRLNTKGTALYVLEGRRA